ncbi:MAG: hypothetical protein PHY41_06575 [Candidatus Cloacimonetes bacterium]|jgi:hypothetical protein|nr:hypothetical protein [Candidatus Cloacimonadota bacterium]MDD3283120.1 hypothetical protein [Candidatus Cloacimonadota bacterium]MDD4232673.1 hypothetical protein [Candidatus Cloacimonadota bacterium]MDD4688075.1 hypothetical protein [Candidatus Cloacimonadota bacterium]MDY0299583.1 hypothetical protein [Candidatus Cloacimonadaceae bacterium]
MDNTVLVRSLATRINELVNIPLITEENEQIFFELVVSILLQMFFNTLDIEIGE